MKSSLLSGLLCLGVGLGVGAVWTGATRPDAARSGEVSLHGGPDRDELAAVVRQELARERALAPRPSPGTVAPPAASGEDVVAARLDEPTDPAAALPPEQAVHAARATNVVSRAVDRGRWSEADKGALIVELDGLPGPVKAEIVGRLAAAVNRGEIQLDVDGLPL